MTLANLAKEYPTQHDGEPETTAKLRWLLTKTTAAFGSTPLTELDAREIAAWRMTLPAGHRFEATQAPRQTLTRAVEWLLLDTNPATTDRRRPPAPAVASLSCAIRDTALVEITTPDLDAAARIIFVPLARLRRVA